MVAKIEFKGTRDGLVINLGEGDWPQVRDTLLDQIKEKGDFFRGARLALEVGSRPLHAAELGPLRDRLSESGITLWAIISDSPLTEQTAQSFGLATRLARPRSEAATQPSLSGRSVPASNGANNATNLFDGEAAILVQRTLRSGFSLQHPGHVVIIGDVNPGAEITAGGDVIVWGRLRGVVHAGAQGNENALVCALDLSPTQLRICGQISIPPKRRGKPQPEIARIKNGQVVAEIWEAGK